MTPENAPEVADQTAAPELSSEDILAELATMRESEEKPAEEPTPEPSTDDTDDADIDTEDSEDDDTDEDDLDEDDDSEDDEDDDESDDDEDEDEDEEPAKDVKGLSKLKAAEKSFNKRMRAQKAELQADKDKWLARVEAAEQSAAAQANYKTLMHSNPVALAEDLGIEGPDAFQALGKYFFQYGKGIAPDAKPTDKQAAESIKRLREQTAGLQQTQAKIAELEKKLEAKEQAAAHQREIQAFTVKLEKLATKKFPLAARILGSKAKEEARENLIEIARDIARKTGGEPSARKVLKRYEVAERRRLEARGIDVDAYTNATKTKKTNPESTAEKKPVSAKKPTNNNSSEDDELSPEQILVALQEARERGEVV